MARRQHAEIGRLTNLPFVSAPNKFAVQGAHDDWVELSGTLYARVSLYRSPMTFADVLGPRAVRRASDPANETGSSIMPRQGESTQAGR